MKERGLVEPSIIVDQALNPGSLTNTQRELKEKGVTCHHVGKEIESKRQIENSELSLERITMILKEELEALGYHFLEDRPMSRDNYVIYCTGPAGANGKIIVHNQGKGGYVLKIKRRDTDLSTDSIIVKNEQTSRIYDSLAEVMLVAAEHEQKPLCVIRIKKYKLTLMSSNDNGLSRFYRLVVDESSIPNADHDGLRQIELEYKGSNNDALDDLNGIELDMRNIMEDIASIKLIITQNTQLSKRQWANEW
jgi:hypothetical protein